MPNMDDFNDKIDIYSTLIKNSTKPKTRLADLLNKIMPISDFNQEISDNYKIFPVAIKGIEQYDKKIKFKTINLEKREASDLKITKINSIPKNKIKKRMGSKDRRRNNKVFLKNKYLTKNFLSLHRLWKEYIDQLLSNCKTDEERHSKIARADFHGAMIKGLWQKYIRFVKYQFLQFIKSMNKD
ncbi:RNase P/RNase MRP complex subunit [Bonamia ostreae]|uniref:RNase P/RNase MRP complex subunit n=1 Tax=Bonamia ostreae TaxID=126728 RepID=A0ABV2AF84_9EUKA